jgi:hypothetical protein
LIPSVPLTVQVPIPKPVVEKPDESNLPNPVSKASPVKSEKPPKSKKPEQAPAVKKNKTKNDKIVAKKSSDKKKNDYWLLIVPLIATIIFLFFFHPKTAKYVDKYLPPGDSTKGILIRAGIFFIIVLLTGISCKVFM